MYPRNLFGNYDFSSIKGHKRIKWARCRTAKFISRDVVVALLLNNQ